MVKHSILLSLFLLILLPQQRALSKTIFVYEFGLDKAKTDLERFDIIYRAHCKAIEENCGISYDGIKELTIEVPTNASSIPLPMNTDFSNVVITVRNQVKDLFLFSTRRDLQSIVISKRNIDKGDFRRYKKLKKGRFLLIVEDQNPWVKNRRGHNYGAYRKDILVVENGLAKNRPVQPYNNKYSSVVCYYSTINEDSLVIKNVVIRRSEDSNKRTFCFLIHNYNNITIKNVSLSTPNSDLTGDRALSISNCANVLLEDVIIEGTYSKSNMFGYGIAMNNVWNSVFRRLKANGNWGIFGTSNISLCRIEDSDINRFDIHCYGRDVFCTNTTFQNAYNQFSSLYGLLSYEKCRFIDFVPVLLEASYYAYTFFEIKIKDCLIKVDEGRPYLIRAGIPPRPDEIRAELSTLCLPNITIEDTKVLLPENIKIWSLFNMGAIPMPEFYGINKIVLSNVSISGSSFLNKIELSNRKVRTKKTVQTIITNSNIELIQN